MSYIKRHWDGIMAWYRKPINNAVCSIKTPLFSRGALFYTYDLLDGVLKFQAEVLLGGGARQWEWIEERRSQIGYDITRWRPLVGLRV